MASPSRPAIHVGPNCEGTLSGYGYRKTELVDLDDDEPAPEPSRDPVLHSAFDPNNPVIASADFKMLNRAPDRKLAIPIFGGPTMTTRFLPTDRGGLQTRVDGFVLDGRDVDNDDTPLIVPPVVAEIIRANLPALPESIIARFHCSDKHRRYPRENVGSFAHGSQDGSDPESSGEV